MRPNTEQLARRSHRWIASAWLALVVGVVASLWCWVGAARSVQQQADTELAQAANDHAEQLRQTVGHYIDLLYGFQTAFEANPSLDRLTFRRMFSAINLQDDQGILAIQFAKLVHEQQRAAFEAQVSQDRSVAPGGYPGFQIKPPGPRERYLPVVYIEPPDGNQHVLGFDQSADPIRLDVMQKARDSGQPQASAPLKLVSGGQQALGFVLRLPVYNRDLPTGTVTERQRAYIGQIGGAIQAAGVAHRVVPHQHWPQWHWRVQDLGRAESPPSKTPLVLFDTALQGEPKAFEPGRHHSVDDERSAEFTVAGRRWRATLSRPPVLAPWQAYPLAVLGGGLLGTLGLWWALRGVGSQQAEAAELAQAMSRDAIDSAERLLAVTNSTRDALMTLDQFGQLVSANPAARTLFGMSPDQALPMAQQLLPLPEALVPSANFLAFIQTHGLALNDMGRRLSARPMHGGELPVHVTVNPLQGDGQAQYLLTARDLREQIAAEEAFQTAQRQLDEVDEMRRVIVHYAPYAILVLNRQGVIQAINPAGETLLGCEAQALIGRSTTQRFFDPEEVSARARLLALRLNQPVRDLQVLTHLAEDCPGSPTEWSLIRPDGQRIMAELSVTVLRDDANHMTGYLAMAQDVTSRAEAELQLQHQAQHDALTGLPNRNRLQEQLKGAVNQCERNGGHLALMFLDMDRFKKINDTLGHHVGDSVIVEVAHRLRAGMRTSDIVARLGGDEFVVLLPQIAQLEDADMVAAKVLELFDSPLRVGPHELRITPSIGLVVYPTHGPDASTLMRHADLAMYQAKNQGRNRVQVFNPQLEAASADTLLLENDLYKAQSRDELRLHFQPQFDCATGHIIGAEALLRWEHQGKLVPPMDFIPFAEETGLIVPMGEWVLQRACAKAQAWRQEIGWPLRIAVNLSAVQLDRCDIVGTVARVLAETGLPPTALELEITETVVVRESLRAADILTQLRALGVNIAIDDFGVGYSSFGYLRELPVDRFKLDRSFLSAIPQSEADCRLAAALIAMAHRLEVGIVAEGVETAEQLAFLKMHHCDEAQGYHLGRPLKEEAFEAMLKAHVSSVTVV